MTLYDRHQVQLEDIASIVEIRSQKSQVGFDYQIANYSINRSDVAIRAEFDESGQLNLFTDSGFQLNPASGSLVGFQQYLNDTLPRVQSDLDQLAVNFMQQVDQVQATGLSGYGEFEALSSQRPVSNVDLPLADSVYPLSIQDGELYISITDLATGERTLSSIAIDPATQSLRDVAASISALDHIQAVIGVQDSNITVVAEPGYSFDFAGRLPTSPDRSKIAGDAAIQFSRRVHWI